ncbi:MAG: response regulator [Faecalibacterium sp.]
MQPLAIIYVDDESLALANFKSTIAGHPSFEHLTLFSNSDEALAHAKKQPIDIAFLDVDIPGTSGFILSEKLTALQPQIRVAFITGNVRYMGKHNQIVKAPYVFKPYCKDDILDALSQLT